MKNLNNNMSERKMIYLCLAHMSEAGVEQKFVQEAEVERGTIDFSQLRITMQKILELAEL